MTADALALARRINELIDREHATKGRDRTLREETCAAQAELTAMFARMHRWTLSPRWFSAECLAARGMRRHARNDWPIDLLDHARFFRKDRRAAAATGCVYGGVPDDAASWAQAHGLLLTAPDFPAWHWPARCTLLLFTPLDLTAPAREPKRIRWPKPASNAVH